MRQRLFTAIVLAVIFIPLIYFGGIYFEIGVTLVGVLGLKELIDLYKKENDLPTLIEVLSYLSIGLLILSEEAILPCIGVIILLLFIPLIFYEDREYNFKKASFLLGTVLFLGFSFYLISTIRLSGLYELIYVLLITILTDTFAYIGGKLFGKHKLASKISPNKTIEGSLIGTIISLIVSTIYYIYMVDPGLNIFIVIVQTIIISLICQLGDLFFSKIKRYYNIKDFSNLLKGHGGVLDRFDSLIFGSIIYIVIKTLFL